MSPKTPNPPFLQQVKRGLLTAGTIAGGLIAVTALVSPSVKYLDERFVHQQEYDTQRTLDSLARVKRDEEYMRRIASVDTGVKCLRGVLPRKDCQK